MGKKVLLAIPVSLETLADEIMSTCGDDEVFDFITMLDQRAMDYDFTRKLRDYFVNEMEKENND